MLTSKVVLFGVFAVSFIALTKDPEHATIVRVVDGDTVEVRLSEPTASIERVRLIGVSAAELKNHEPCALDAQRFLRVLAAGEVVSLTRDSVSSNRDGFGRLLRYIVYADGRDVNAELIASGYCKVYTKYAFDKLAEFEKLEDAARTEKRGCWGTVWNDPNGIPLDRLPTVALDRIVFITKSGGSYHSAGCKALKNSAIPIPLSQVIGRYKPCKLCNPPPP